MTVELAGKHTSYEDDDSIVAGGEGVNDSFTPSDQAERKTESYYPLGWQQPVLGSTFNHTFDRWWQKHGHPYEQAVLAGGGTPWPCDPEKRKAVLSVLGVDGDLEDMELRRALWARRYNNNNNKEIR